MQGILLVDKPQDWTSFDVVNYVRKIVAQAEGKKPKNTKVGHTGTLDPKATGLLVLLIGKEYTRRATELSKLEKTYEVTMKLGETSSTGDEEGEKVTVSNDRPNLEEIKRAFKVFLGEILQKPPAFSAIKVNGQRAYKLAREGKDVVIEPRPVTIYKNDLKDYEYPLVKFVCEVSSGTYIRSLVEDLGKELGCGAYMSALRRSKVGKYRIDDAIKIDGLNSERIENSLITLETAKASSN